MKDALANVHALKMRKSCAVGMRNAILRNRLKSLPMLDSCNHYLLSGKIKKYKYKYKKKYKKNTKNTNMFSECEANSLLKMYVRVNLE